MSLRTLHAAANSARVVAKKHRDPSARAQAHTHARTHVRHTKTQKHTRSSACKSQKIVSDGKVEEQSKDIEQVDVDGFPRAFRFDCSPERASQRGVPGVSQPGARVVEEERERESLKLQEPQLALRETSAVLSMMMSQLVLSFESCTSLNSLPATGRRASSIISPTFWWVGVRASG